MKSQETLSKIMELLNLQDEVKLESMKLENGTTIEAEAFEANQEVFIVTEEDEKIALPVGDAWHRGAPPAAEYGQVHGDAARHRSSLTKTEFVGPSSPGPDGGVQQARK